MPSILEVQNYKLEIYYHELCWDIDKLHGFNFVRLVVSRGFHIFRLITVRILVDKLICSATLFIFPLRIIKLVTSLEIGTSNNPISTLYLEAAFGGVCFEVVVIMILQT